MRQLLRQLPGLDPSALRGRKISKFFCICSRRWAAFRLFARADGFRNLFLIFPFIFLWCMYDPLENGVYHRSQHSNDTIMTPRMNTIGTTVYTILNPSLPIRSCALNHSNINSQRIYFPSCLGGHGISPNEQNTQQSPRLGFSTIPHALHS